MIDKPWMKVFIGDWIRDTRKLSSAGRGLLMDLKCAMWTSDITGVITGVIAELSILLGYSERDLTGLLGELQLKRAVAIEYLPNGVVKISSPEMIADARKAASAAERGREGMKKRWGKKEKDTITPVITNDIANGITHMEYDISGNGIDSNRVSDKVRGVGEGKAKGEEIANMLTGRECMSLDECRDVFLKSDKCARLREVLLKRLYDVGGVASGEALLFLLSGWAMRFNDSLLGQLMEVRELNEWTSHFNNWMNKQDLSIDPRKTVINGAKKGFGKGAAGGAGFDDLDRELARKLGAHTR